MIKTPEEIAQDITGMGELYRLTQLIFREDLLEQEITKAIAADRDRAQKLVAVLEKIAEADSLTYSEDYEEWARQALADFRGEKV